MYLAGGGGGGQAMVKGWLADPEHKFTTESAQYFATKAVEKGVAVPLSVQKALAQAGQEIVSPGVKLATEAGFAWRPTAAPASIVIGTATPAQYQAQQAAITAAVNTQLQTPTPTTPTPAPQPTILATPAPASVWTPSPVSTAASAPISYAPATADLTSAPIDASKVSFVPGGDNKIILLLGAGALALLLLSGKKRKGKR